MRCYVRIALSLFFRVTHASDARTTILDTCARRGSTRGINRTGFCAATCDHVSRPGRANRSPAGPTDIYYYYYYYHHHHHHRVNKYPLNLLLLISSSSSSSSLSPLCRVFIHIFLRQTMSIGNTVFQLFCHYYLWCLYR